ncbi:GNAT family N-acetyltransferase [Microlunatus sp. Gsoil 973]|uniref:GNAT family N-acetyltransferase n=1 Tax=Microlunatus sp. Gsoil 973 TaxID=2672569 RepID=UPI0012B44D7B|nr:GNAT family N-acetyltransferase [Microlunatus sp. Gsoil 973]QGN34017.1 GNAT family N-acetyltransferase [Microlunatus sp. Gsoil 973]
MSEGLTRRYTVRALDPSTWDAFAELVERNNGVFGGCWCMGHHAMDNGETYRFQKYDKRAKKEELVRSGRAHAALVFDADGLAQGWAKYGRLAEQPIIEHNRRAYNEDPPPTPDWRITCYYTDSKHRRQGIGRAALEGSLDLIAQAGGGLVEALPEATSGRVAHGRFLFEMTVELYEEYGFHRVRQIGKHRWIVHRHVGPSDAGLRPELVGVQRPR